ncbi:helix-turn-helix transcriptional regulator [Roseburia sp. 499]|uniref:helix-turn-helix transcriptional regulator n=1 Tax=Roseburia sp. 499 TaxID=1261634 RepID=UPI0009524C66|nr:helix-turn-helix domain-containing protein [Roseburia sp. 499]WVK68579.1 helix-turn-helix domain-containing protein [Roseburia sp. 499]
MDLKKIGCFLSELRHEHNETQEKLGEILGVSNKTISRWENGNYLPPVEMLQLLSKHYSVSINEILSGERLDSEAYRERAEENLKTTLSKSSFSLQERIVFFRKKWIKEHWLVSAFAIIGSIALLVLGIIVGERYLCVAGMIATVVFPVVSYNRMMAYIERQAYDGKG